ncbi:MAG TPA: ATP-dependent DNA helicase [Actinomycetota bacterium]|nr:ATP-dependent DNA helicase [Actinomycetota bacterium]
MTPPFSPDERQALVLDHGSGTLLVTGPSGTGKTAVLRERFARLIEQGADPDRVALVVGSSAAREAARAALLQRLSNSLSGLHVVTMHGLANRILKARAEQAGGGEPPRLLSATEQFAKVQDLLGSQDPGEWPAYGRLLGMRGFADEVRQFLSRAQEALLTPDHIVEAADRRGLTGWRELARFLGEYEEVLDALNLADFASLLQRAASEAPEGEPPFDHVLVDEFHDTTIAAEAILRGLRASDLVVAADPDGHVFSFQGTSRVPLDRFAEVFGGDRVELVTNHRAPQPVVVEARVAPHASEEHASIGRELRRLHVENGVDWNDMAVVVRRQGTHLGGLLRALDDARIPRAMPERGLSLTAEPATRPYVLALRWLVADDTVEREALIEQLLVSDVVGLSPAAARALLRASRAATGSISNALDVTEGLTAAESEAVVVARETLSRAALFAGMSVQDAFRLLWEQLPCSRRLVDRAGESPEARRELDTVVTFANVVAETDESSGDTSVTAFLESLDAGEHGPGYSAWERGRSDAVQVLTAHGAVGREFDTVLVTGVTEGNFPSLSRPEPMFDLGVLEHPVTNAERNRDRLDDERRLFDMVTARAKRRVVLSCADVHPHDERSARSRFVDASSWARAPSGPFDDPVSTREAAAAWRSQLADEAREPFQRLAALDGLVVLGVDARRWWFQRDWTDTGRPLHETIRVSYSRLSNLEACELMHVLGDELGLGKPGGYHAWVGKTVHSILEQAEKGEIPKEPRALVEALDRRWRPQEFPSMAVANAFHALARDHMLRNWFDNYAERPAAGIERFFEFEFQGATVIGYIDRIGPAVQDGYVITDFKTGKSDNAGPPRDSLQLGIYYLAVQESPDLAEFQPVKTVELAFLRGNWRSPNIDYRKWMVTERDEEAYQAEMRERLAALIARKRELNELGVFRPNPYANCRFCDFQSLCPLYAEGQPVFPVEAVREGVPA